MLTNLIALLLAAESPPTNEMAGLIRVSDYPREALEKNESGTVGVEVSADGTGRVTGCRVVSSSKSMSLDRATCQIIATRGQFPQRAKEHGGKPFTFETHVSWETGPIGLPLTVLETRIVFTPGQTITCRVESPSWMQMDGACEAARPSAEAAMLKLSSQGPVDGSEYVVEMSSIPGDHLSDNKIGEAAGERLLGKQVVLLTLGADGKIAKCVGDSESPPEYVAGWWESLVRNEAYEPTPAGTAGHSARQMTKINAVYLRPRQAPRAIP